MKSSKCVVIWKYAMKIFAVFYLIDEKNKHFSQLMHKRSKWANRNTIKAVTRQTVYLTLSLKDRKKIEKLVLPIFFSLLSSAQRKLRKCYREKKTLIFHLYGRAPLSNWLLLIFWSETLSQIHRQEEKKIRTKLCDEKWSVTMEGRQTQKTGRVFYPFFLLPVFFSSFLSTVKLRGNFFSSNIKLHKIAISRHTNV